MEPSESPVAVCVDDELVRRAQEGDRAAFDELFRRTAPASLKLAVSILRDREEAEDQVQTSYLNAWRYVSQFQRESKFSTWMSRIVVNQCLMRLRKVHRLRLVSLTEEGDDGEIREIQPKDARPTPEATLAGSELEEGLKQEIQKLPHLLRGVLVLRDVDQLSTSEVAARLGLTPSAVKSRLLRARAELRARLEKYRTREDWISSTG